MSESASLHFEGKEISLPNITGSGTKNLLIFLSLGVKQANNSR